MAGAHARHVAPADIDPRTAMPSAQQASPRGPAAACCSRHDSSRRASLTCSVGTSTNRGACRSRMSGLTRAPWWATSPSGTTSRSSTTAAPIRGVHRRVGSWQTRGAVVSHSWQRGLFRPAFVTRLPQPPLVAGRVSPRGAGCDRFRYQWQDSIGPCHTTVSDRSVRGPPTAIGPRRSLSARHAPAADRRSSRPGDVRRRS